MTTLLERRMRGDLIEMFKIINGHVSYGSELFNLPSSRLNVAAREVKFRHTTSRSDFFAQRVLKFWNCLPCYVKDSSTVNCFKNRLDNFRKKGYAAGTHGQFWELSYEIFDRLEVSASQRSDYRKYMLEHLFVAKHRKINIR